MYAEAIGITKSSSKVIDCQTRPSYQLQETVSISTALARMDDRALTVMVVEDELLTRMLAVEVLAEAGFDVIETEQAEQALAALHARGGDVVVLFTDIHMPGSMTGLELAHHVRGSWPRVALLIASGNGRPPVAQLPAGSRFLPKPYDPADVVAHVQALAAA